MKEGTIRIGVVSDQFGNLQRGGAETQVDMTCQALEKTGLVQICRIGPETSSLENIDIVHFFKSKPYYTSLTKILKDRNIPYVVSTIAFPTELSKVICYQKTIGHLPKKIKELTQTGLILRLWHEAEKLYPNTSAEAEYLKNFNPGSKIEIIPNGIDLSELKSLGSADDFLNKHPELKELGGFVLNVGRIERRKNQIRLLKACEEIGIPLVLIGKIGDKAYYDELIADKSEYLHYLGPEYDKNILFGAYKACNVFCLPSMIETPGIVALEAGFYNKPIVITQNGGTKDYFEDSAYYVDPNSVQSIKSGIIQACQNPTSVVDIVSRYTWDNVARLYIKSYRTLLSRQD